MVFVIFGNCFASCQLLEMLAVGEYCLPGDDEQTSE